MASSDANALADAANLVRDRWENEATQFIADLRSLAQTVFDPRLADARLPTVFTLRDDEMRTAIDGLPVKPATLAFNAPTDMGDSPAVSISDAVVVTVPTFDTASPVLDLPTRPEQRAFTAPAEPTVKSVSVPDSPVVTLPTAPTLQPVAFPDVPSISLPTYQDLFPGVEEFTIESTRFAYTEETVLTPLLDAAGNLLLGDLENGGYGIEVVDEDALWERARDRELRQGQEAQEQVLDEFSSRGFTMPTGAASMAMERARKQAEDALAEANRQIAVTRAELFRDTRQFAITQGTAVDNTRLQHAGFRMERALNVSRAVVEFSIAVHDSQVGAYNARVQGYSAFVSAYGAQLQGELSKVQIYSEQVRAAVEQQRSQQIEVELYQALISASQSIVALYETQVRAVATELDAERLKVEVFSTQVEAYATEVRANATEFDAYEAGVRGELAKAQVFSTEVDAYRTRVQAVSVESEIRNRQVQVEIERSRANLAGYASEVEAYRSRLTAETERVGALLNEYGADTAQYAAAMNAWEGLVRVSVSEIESVSRQLVNEVQLEQSNARLQLEAAVEGARRRFESANAGTVLTKSFADLASESLGLLAAQISEV